MVQSASASEPAWEGPDGFRPARLTVGVVSAGRVGSALGVALERAGHVVVACSGPFDGKTVEFGRFEQDVRA